MRREYLQTIAAHTEIATGKAHIVAFILKRDELADGFALVNDLPFFQVKDHR